MKNLRASNLLAGMIDKAKLPVGHVPNKNIEVDVRYRAEDNKVIILFNAPIDNLQQTPEGAVALAKALLEGAKRLNPTVVEGITWSTT